MGRYSAGCLPSSPSTASNTHSSTSIASASTDKDDGPSPSLILTGTKGEICTAREHVLRPESMI
jgi:hypothetical protein